MTRNEAEALAAKIQTFWRDRGCDVTVMTERMEYDPKLRAVRYEIRSNLVNGRPAAAERRLKRAA